MSNDTLGMFGLPGGSEWIIIGLVALLVFGRRLPDVARSVGKSIVEFKRGLRDVKDDIDTQSRIESSTPTPLPSQKDVKPGESDASTVVSEPKKESSSTPP